MKKDNFDWGEPYADPEQISAFDHYRITVLQPDLIRVETSENGAYTDSRTLAVWNRRFPKCEYDLEFGVKYVVVTTSKAKFYFDRKAGRVTEADIGGRRVVLKKEKSMPGTARGSKKLLRKPSFFAGTLGASASASAAPSPLASPAASHSMRWRYDDVSGRRVGFFS